jgi:eukaryotic-like serine/threonine-protein kinase
LARKSGNRFLRLPEHAVGGRDSASDITQIVGLLFYVLTGHEPRVLVDEYGKKPHQRSPDSDLLPTIPEPSLRRLRSLFDRGFDPVLLTRFQSLEDLKKSLELIQAPETSETSFEVLMSALDEIVQQPSHIEVSKRGEVLRDFTHSAIYSVDSFAKSKNLHMSQTGGGQGLQEAIPWAITKLALHSAAESPNAWVTLRFEWRGPDDIVFVVDEIDKWRGASPNDALEEAVVGSVVSGFIKAQAG